MSELSGQVETVVRPAARLLIIDEQDRILLFRTEDIRLDEPRLWLTPGGGLEVGETYEQAGARELREETGLELPLGPCVWTRQHIFRWGNRTMEARERFFVVRTPAFTLDDTGWSEAERRLMTAHRWWKLPEIAVTTEVFVPRRLAQLLPPILAGEYPSEPVETGV